MSFSKWFGLSSTSQTKKETLPEAPEELGKTGWLIKQGKNNPNWLKRYFILDPKTLLLTYHENPSSDPKGQIDLRDVASLMSIDETSTKKRRDHCFGIDCESRVYYIQASSDEEARSWFSTLSLILQHIANFRRRNQLPAPRASPKPAHRPVRQSLLRENTSYEEVPFESHDEKFKQFRKAAKHISETRITRLEVRIRKYLYADRTRKSAQAFDESIVPWERSQSACQVCNTKFGIMNRLLTKDYCRLCGNAVCQNGCAQIYSLMKLGKALKLVTRPPSKQVESADILVCHTCDADLKHVVEASDSPLISLYEEMTSIKSRVVNIISQLQPKVDTILSGTKSITLYNQAETLQLQAESLLSDLASVVLKISRIKTDDTSRQAILDGIAKHLNEWMKQTRMSVKTVMLQARQLTH